MDFLHAVFTVDWHEIFRLDQAEHKFLLLLATVSRGVDVVNLTMNNLYTSFRDNINQLVNAGRITRDRARGKDDCISRLQLHLTVGTIGNPRQGCHRLTLTSGTHNQHFTSWVVLEFIWFNEGIFRNLDIAQLNPVDNSLFHGSAKDRNLTAGLDSSICCLLEPEDV